MSYSYFYGPQDAEQYQFYRIPKLLITGEQFREVSIDAKLLYGLMLDRLSLSIRNSLFDDENRAYIIYTIEEVMEDLHCGNQKAVKLLSELENKAGLIRKKRQGLGKPSLIYVLKFAAGYSDDDPGSKIKNCDNHISGDVDPTHQEMSESHGNNTDHNNTEYSEPDPIHLSADPSEAHMGMDAMGEDPMQTRQVYEDYFRDRLDIEDLKANSPHDHRRIDELLGLIVDTVCSTAQTIRCAGENRPAEVVKSRFMKLDYSHIQYVLDSIHANTTEIRNIKAYLLTILYNAPLTIDHYYEAKVNHDMHRSAPLTVSDQGVGTACSATAHYQNTALFPGAFE